MSNSLASGGFNFNDIEILDILYPDTAYSPDEIVQMFGMDLGFLFFDLKRLYMKGLIDWSGDQEAGKKKMPHHKKFSKTRFFMTPLGRTLFSDEDFNYQAYKGAYQNLVPDQKLI